MIRIYSGIDIGYHSGAAELGLSLMDVNDGCSRLVRIGVPNLARAAGTHQAPVGQQSGRQRRGDDIQAADNADQLIHFGIEDAGQRSQKVQQG